MNAKVKLKQIATVQMGYSFRSSLDITDDGDISVIQMKDLLGDNTVDCGRLVKIHMKTVKNHHVVERGDLVFRSRGQITTSAIVKDDQGKAIVSAPLLRIRVNNPNKILPEYLNWYISQRDAQAFFNSRAKGSVQKMITKETIDNLEVPLPSLEVQKNIIELAWLLTNEQDLLKQLSQKREQYISNKLMKMVRGEVL